ncbi:aspartic peptidase domain-containing protein [Phycomyces nitens]|nr:aspartic peptidase domain-containing protein [Phycomyces nitens]
MYLIKAALAITLYALPLIHALSPLYDKRLTVQPIRVSLSRTENGHLAAIQRSIAGEQVLNKRGNNTASLYNANGREYIIQVDIGTPPQRFDLTLDTGSSELWVPFSECSVDMCPYSRFNGSQSSSLQMTPKTFSIQYSIGEANGTYAYETVTIGNVTINNQLVGMVNTTKNILGTGKSGDQANGILGLGFPGLNTLHGVDDDIPFAFSLVKAKVISDPIFAIHLNSLLNYGNSGEISFGATDPARYNGTIEYVPVVSYNVDNTTLIPNVGPNHANSDSVYLYWALPGQSIVANGYVNNFTDPIAFMFDTGTTLTYMPKNVTDGLLSALSGSVQKVVYDTYNGVYRIGCDFAAKATAQSIEFHLSKSVRSKTMKPVVVKVPVVDLVIPLDGTTPSNSKLCMFGIAPSITDSIVPANETWVIGQSVLRSIYTVYDMSLNRIGIVPAINTYNPANATNLPTSTTTQPTKNGSSFKPISGAGRVGFSTQSVVVAVGLCILAQYYS